MVLNIKTSLVNWIFMIGDPVEGSRWDIEKEAPCIKCQRGAVRLIKIGPAHAAVTCTNCMAERRYIVHSAELTG